MQAIVLAAGMGKRLGSLTENNTKCMIKVHGKTLIERMLEQLAVLNLSRIVLVIGYKGDKLRNAIGNSFKGCKIEYVENPIFDKTNNIYSLYLAKDYLLKEDTLLLESDLIFDSKILERVLLDPYPNLAVVSKYQSWMDGTVVSLDNENNIVTFVPKKNFQFRDIDVYFKTVNIYKFSKEFSYSHYVPFLEAYSRALGNNEYYEQVLRVITLLEKPDIKALRLEGENWYEIDDIQDLNNAETIFADKSSRLNGYQNRYGGYWRYPELIDFCYLVNPFFPPEKLIEEIKANFTTLLTQYPSGLDVNSLLAAKYFSVSQKYIVVGNGAAELVNAYCSNTSLVTGIILPTFEEYQNRIEEKLRVYFRPQNSDFSYSVEDIISYFSPERIQQLILINPDNPSGNFIPLADLYKLLEWVKSRDIRLILDESFVDFTSAGRVNSLLSDEVLMAYPNLIVVKSISKSYGVPGLRLGIVASSDETLMNGIRKNVSIWNINSFAEFYLQIYGKYEKLYDEACILFREERDRLFQQLKKVSYLEVFPSQANYFLCKLKKGSAYELTDALLTKHKMLIKDCTLKSGFEKKPYIRVAVRDKADNEKLITALNLISI